MSNLSATGFQRLRDAAARLLEEQHLPGLSIGIVQGDDLVFAEGFGLADIESGRPHDPALRHRIGSITKTMVGLCAMALVDEGRLSLDESLVDHLPEVTLHGPGDSITIRHLLTHTPGIGEVPNLKDLPMVETGLFVDERPEAAPAEAFPDGITVELSPGVRWAYCNIGFALLGEIIARVEKAPMEEVIRRLVFEPLGMRNSDMQDRPHEALSTGYHHEPSDDLKELLSRVGRTPPQEETVDGHNIRGKYQHVRGRAAGAVQSTVPDMAKYASALLRHSRGIVRPETFQLMVSRRWSPDPRLPAWGLSFSVRSHFGHPGFGHGGSILGGWNSYLAVFPEEGLGVVLHTNISHDGFDAAIVPAVLKAVFGAPNFAPSAIAVPPAIVASAPGVYEIRDGGPLINFRPATQCGRVQITAADGRLALRSRHGPWKRGWPLVPADAAQPDLFAVMTDDPSPPRIVMLLDAHGAVTGLRFPQFVDMYRNETLSPWS